MQILNQTAFYLAKVLKHHNIQHIVTSPGSRNAPIIQALTELGGFAMQSVMDERSAGFIALGIAQASQKPVVLTCTSGSALVNYMPALTEAYYRKLPLLVISADRPKEWIGQYDGQTMNQEGALKNVVTKSYTLKAEIDKDSIWFNSREINKCLLHISEKEVGPLHLNFPIKEPLYEAQDISADYNYPIIQHIGNSQIKELKQKLSSEEKVMVLVGQMDQTPNWVADLAQRGNTIVLSETTSNYKGEGIQQIDRALVTIPEEQHSLFSPDICIYLGGQIVSKKIKQFLRANAPKEVWRIQNSVVDFPDTFQKITHIITAKNLHEALPQSSPKSEYRSSWMKQLINSNDFIADIPFSDLWVFNNLSTKICEPAIVHCANSSAIRYLQLFQWNKNIQHFTNRGVSGIDGCTSTAIGHALAKPQLKNYFITGDVSFFYDANALHSLHLVKGFKIILINNCGGNIFRLLDGPNQIKDFEKHIETSHQTKAKALANMHSFEYFHAANKSAFKEQWNEFQSTTQNALLELETPALENPIELKNFFKHIKNGSEEKLDAH